MHVDVFRRIAFALAASLFGGTHGTAGQSLTLHQRVSEVKPGQEIEVSSTPMYPSWDVPTVLAFTDLAVEGVVDSATAAIRSDDTFVDTTYSFTIDRVLFASKATIPSTSISAAITTVRFIHGSGRANIVARLFTRTTARFGHSVQALDSLCFLPKDKSDSSLYRIVNGPCGAYQLEGDRVKSFLPPGHPVGSQYDGAAVDVLRGAIQAGPSAR